VCGYGMPEWNSIRAGVPYIYHAVLPLTSTLQRRGTLDAIISSLDHHQINWRLSQATSDKPVAPTREKANGKGKLRKVPSRYPRHHATTLDKTHAFRVRKDDDRLLEIA
jgi:hypothetical protein